MRGSHDDTNEARLEDRAGGVMLGMAIADGWHSATEVALCVGDAAATGLALTDAGTLGLLERNLRALRLERHSPTRSFESNDELLAATAVVALAHLHDTPQAREEATRAVVATIHPSAVVDHSLLWWVEVVAETVRSGVLPDISRSEDRRDGSPGGRAGTVAADVHAAIQAVRRAEQTGDDDAARFAAGLTAVSSAPAATGAVLGSRFGWEALPRELAEKAHGWPEAGKQDLVGIGLLALRRQARATDASRAEERSGGTVPIERWDDFQESVPSTGIRAAVAAEGGPESSSWHRTLVALTAADADTRGMRS
jgi:hypothetical protein